MAYLSERAIQGLKQYKYKPGGYTWLDDLHQPFWNWLVDHLPMWLAPNLITLMGMLSLVIAYYLNAVYLPTLQGVGPWWLYLISGASMIFYTNLDCIDGKQARRTGSSSPLGQMFDHGVDALAVHLVLNNLHCTFSSGVSWMTTILIVAVKVPWLLAQWEEYHTGVMLYGNGWWGVVEINYGVGILHLLVAAFGPGWLKVKPMEELGVNLDLGEWEELRGIILFIVAAGAVVQTIGQLVRVFSRAHPCPEEERGCKEMTRSAQLFQILEKVALGATALMWLHASPIASARNILSTFGIAYAWEATHMIVAHMTKEPIVTTWWPTGTMGVAFLNAQIGILDPSLVAFVVNAVIIVGYLHYVVTVVNEICAALNINCLTIKHKESSQ